MTLTAADLASPGRCRRARAVGARAAAACSTTPYAGSSPASGTMAFVLVFNFFLFRMLPGDPISLYTRGRNVDREQVRELRRQLNEPIGQQFLDYVRNPFSAGVDSTQFSRPVWDVIGDYVWPTLVLLVTATLFSAAIGIAIGISGGWKPRQHVRPGLDRGHADALRDARVLARAWCCSSCSAPASASSRASSPAAAP